MKRLLVRLAGQPSSWQRRVFIWLLIPPLAVGAFVYYTLRHNLRLWVWVDVNYARQQLGLDKLVAAVIAAEEQERNEHATPCPSGVLGAAAGAHRRPWRPRP